MIRKLTKNGKTTLMIDLSYRLPEGKRVRVRKVAPIQTESAAKRYEKESLKEVVSGNYQRKEEKKLTLSEFVPRFLKSCGRDGNKPSELTKKQTILRKHIKPSLGDTSIDKIDWARLNIFMDDKLGTGLSPKTVKNIMGVLGRLLSKAEELGQIDRMPRIPSPKLPKHDPDFLTGQEVKRLLAATEPQWRAMVTLAVATGLRRGELLGLQWKDVDWERGTLRILRQVSEGKIETPKSNRSRMIGLSPETLEILKQHRSLRGLWIFCQDNGHPLTRDMIKRPLQRAFIKAGLQKLNPGPGERRRTGAGWHLLRHTCASLLVKEEAPLKKVQELLGHSTITMTEKYAHLEPTGQHDAVIRLDKWIHTKAE